MRVKSLLFLGGCEKVFTMEVVGTWIAPISRFLWCVESCLNCGAVSVFMFSVRSLNTPGL
ncbi:MAG: hypothetical protein FFODKBPE_00342 [Candidatus Argoarchaeum ethanivorans]|uniref:Uncharacterized protein n=1 Tax=Candidatus Argoarchaeum ethanivorans TaxID=2608793 RepID=A0A811TAE1_9EURY|nr:MAG: hypothetical protein FFODKBPE_00342 [Candidatus Argoarchaeum ethanivorans]